MKKTSSLGRKLRPQDSVAEALRRQILEGELKSGDYLLPERELVTAFKVSSRVVRESLARLESEGLVVRKHGSGTIVSSVRPEELAARQKNAGLIIQNRMRDIDTLQFFDSLQQTFQRGGYGTTVLVTNQDPARETALVEQLVKDRVSGIVVFSCHDAGSFDHLKAAMEAGVKVCVFDHYFPGLPCNFVGIDDRLAGFDAAAHLIRCGCEELVFVNAINDWTTHTLRQEGFHEAVAKMGGGMRSHVLRVPMQKEREHYIRQGLAPLLRGAKKRLGIVAWWDQAAIDVMNFLRDEGWSVPGQAAVVGFSNEVDSAMTEIPLTTMQITQDELARFSAYVLMDQMQRPELEPQHIALRSHLIIRDSCGCFSPARQTTHREAISCP